MVAHTLVDALVVAAEDYDVALHREVVSHVLVELFAVWRREYHLVVVALRLQLRYAAVYRFALHHHSGESAVRIVVYAAPFVSGVVAQVVQMNLCETLLLCASKYRFVDKALKHFGQYGYNVYSHKCKITQFCLHGKTKCPICVI